MVRAELGVGNTDAALALLKRIKSRYVTLTCCSGVFFGCSLTVFFRDRQYPDAVYNRISGVMTDHSLPPIEPLSPLQAFP